jgi:hypothetical protein
MSDAAAHPVIYVTKRGLSRLFNRARNVSLRHTGDASGG